VGRAPSERVQHSDLTAECRPEHRASIECATSFRRPIQMAIVASDQSTKWTTAIERFVECVETRKSSVEREAKQDALVVRYTKSAWRTELSLVQKVAVPDLPGVPVEIVAEPLEQPRVVRPKPALQAAAALLVELIVATDAQRLHVPEVLPLDI
jgi:hypothetical protein